MRLNLQNHHVKLNRTARAKLREKHQRLWKTYLNTQDNVYMQYKKVSNQLRTLTRKSVKFVERENSNQVKDNPKAFWKYVNKKRKCNVKIPSLHKFGKKEELVESGVDKADTLTSKFNSVFNVETHELWNLSSKQLIHDYDFGITFTKDTVLKKLNRLGHNLSPGPDGINSQIKEGLRKYCTIFSCYFS